MNKQELESYQKAGSIAKEIKQFAREKTKPGIALAELAELIESKIIELGAEIAFPVNLAIDDIAAHYTPSLNNKTPASGLLKIDIGVHVNGFIADTAITIDLTPNNKHKEIIKTTEQALENAIKIVQKDKEKTKINEIGKTIHKTITKAGFSPVKNLSGHSLDKYNIHAGITIPNYDNGNENLLGKGGFAIEPFATTGEGMVYEGEPSGIYALIGNKSVRDPTARKILTWIKENKSTLPFSERELERNFGAIARLGIKRLEEAGIIKSYGMLIEKSHKPVTQAEHTLIIYEGKVEVIS